MIFTYVLYVAAGGCLVASLLRDRGKTRMALRKGWKAFEGILPQFVGVIIITGVLMAVFDAATISRILGARSGWLGVLGASLVGAVTLIPGFVAFPTAAVLLRNGAGYMQIGAFVSSLMMVGVVTLPVEIRYFGRKVAAVRNLLAFAFSFLVAAVIGVVCG
jgi:uncharacterized membrane protein YraQ (UPF0718 family)